MKILKNNRVNILLIFFFIISAFLVLNSDIAFAKDDPTDGTGGMSTIMCNVVHLITGTIGKIIAVIVLASIAIGLFLGKVTWGVAIAAMVGMGLLFGAPGLIQAISSTTGQQTTPICPPAK